LHFVIALSVRFAASGNQIRICSCSDVSQF
jgi:hypothetical protein